MLSWHSNTSSIANVFRDWKYIQYNYCNWPFLVWFVFLLICRWSSTLIVSYIHWSVRSEFMSQASKLVSLDINCEHFHSISMPMSLFSILVQCRRILPCTRSIRSTVLQTMTLVLCTGLGSHACLTSWGGQVMLCFFDWTLRNCLVWPTYIRIPSIVVAYGYSQTCHVQNVSRLSSEWAWYIQASLCLI